MWKHHAAQPQADRINALAAEIAEPWLPRYGGKISAKRQFAKALQLLDEDVEIYDHCARWIEAADWIVWQLWHRDAQRLYGRVQGIRQDGRYPSVGYLGKLDPRFAAFATDRIAHPLSQLGDPARMLTPEAASWTGLPAGITVAVGNVDARVTAAAVQSTGPGQLVPIMGTPHVT